MSFDVDFFWLGDCLGNVLKIWAIFSKNLVILISINQYLHLQTLLVETSLIFHCNNATPPCLGHLVDFGKNRKWSYLCPVVQGAKVRRVQVIVMQNCRHFCQKL
jgi:hypothetical protein